MNFPYIETHVNLIIDYHIVYATLTAWLVVANAGRVWGLDGWLADRPCCRARPRRWVDGDAGAGSRLHREFRARAFAAIRWRARIRTRR